MFLGATFDAPPVPTKRALLLLDLQNDFVSREGKLAVKDAEAIVPRVAALAKEFRETGEVVWVTTEYESPRETVSTETGSYVVILPRFLPQDLDEPDHVLQSADPAVINETDGEAFLADFVDDAHKRCCLPGSNGCQMPEELESVISSSDLVITKSDYSAFATGSLLMTLRTKLVTELFLCGSLSHISVYATAVDAIRYGFTITIVEDCMSHGSALCHDEALRQMKDMMGADAISSGELIALLNGDGETGSELVSEKQAHTRKPTARGSSDSLTLRPRVEDWIKKVNNDSRKSHRSTSNTVRSRESSRSSLSTSPELCRVRSREGDFEGNVDSRSSPPRKRSTEDGELHDILREVASMASSRSARKTASSAEPRRIEARSIRRRRTNKQSPSEEGVRRNPSHRHKKSPTRDVETPGAVEERELIMSRLPDPANAYDNSGNMALRVPKISSTVIEERFGEGDSYLVSNVIPESTLDGLFERLKDEVQWQKMYHRSGEVPRLVAVQGWVQKDSSQPIYRHPADESPPLLPYSPTVAMIKERVQKVLGQPCNHVLIQLYRSGEDSISEHSDKTLDIVRDTSIANFSLGAQRTMILRTKRSHRASARDHAAASTLVAASSFEKGDSSEKDEVRRNQRIPLPHNSLFVLGPATNKGWLHSIRADKRRAEEKQQEELAFNGERVSLTFRQIGTFVNPDAGLIWGQGATSKLAQSPRSIAIDDQTQVESMVAAFGKENHQAAEFDWDSTYGKGFDVVNFTTTRNNFNGPNSTLQVVPAKEPSTHMLGKSLGSKTESVLILSPSIDPIADLRVKLCLTKARVPFVVENSTASRKQPEVGGKETDPKFGFVKLKGFRQIVAHFCPTEPVEIHPRLTAIQISWHGHKATRPMSASPTRVLLDLKHVIEESSLLRLGPEGDRVGQLEQDVWLILHDILLRQGELSNFDHQVLKDFYCHVAKTELFREALGGDSSIEHFIRAFSHE